MNRHAILRKARGLRRLAENPAATPDEAARARALLERLQRKYKLSDAETQDPTTPPSTQHWAAAPISCPHLLVDFVAAVVGAGGGAVQPSVRGTLVVAGPVLELKRLVRLAERTTQLLQVETADRARLAQAMRLPFDAPSLWTGIAQGLIQRLLERAAGADGSSGEPRRGAPVPEPKAPTAAAASPAAALPCQALVLYQPPPKRPEMPLHRRQVDIVNRMDLQHGHQVASRFQLDIAGDLPVTQKPTAWRPPGAARETPAQGFARAEAWLDGVKASIGDNPIVTAFAGAVIGGMKERDATREYAGVLWEAWRQLGNLVRRESLMACFELLQPELVDPRRLVLASMCGEDDEPLRIWCRAAAPRTFEHDAAIDRERRARAEAEKARREAELAEDLKRWAERQPVEEWSSWVNNPAPSRSRHSAPASPRFDPFDPVVWTNSAEEFERFKEALHKESSHQYSRALLMMDELDQAADEAERRESARAKNITRPAPADAPTFDFEQLDRTITRLQREQQTRAAFHLDARIADEIRRSRGPGPRRRG